MERQSVLIYFLSMAVLSMITFMYIYEYGIDLYDKLIWGFITLQCTIYSIVITCRNNKRIKESKIKLEEAEIEYKKFMESIDSQY